jgi:hypothetical protein
MRRYTPEEILFLKKYIPGRTDLEAAMLFNKAFWPRIVRERQVSSFKKNHKVRSGLDARFKPGCVSHNKGKKGVYYPGCEKGWFKPGNSINRRPVGSERISIYGYIEIKVADKRSRSANVRQKNWKPKHAVIWEHANGPVPKGHKIAFADGNTLNLDLDNLLLVSNAEHAVMNSWGLRSPHKTLTKAGKELAALKIRIASRKRQLKKTSRTRNRRAV